MADIPGVVLSRRPLDCNHSSTGDIRWRIAEGKSSNQRGDEREETEKIAISFLSKRYKHSE